MQNGNSSTNTVLLIILLLIVIGVGVWWFTMQNNATPATPDEVPARNDAGLDIEIQN